MWEYDGAQTELIGLTKGLAQAALLEQWTAAARDNTRPSGSKLLSFVAKPFFLVGDTSVIGGMLYITGAPALTAVATGLSAATGAVFAGSAAGHNAAVAYQRSRRGQAPDGCPDALTDLYEDPDGNDEPWSFWAKLGAAYAFVLGTGVMAIGIGAGIAPAEAMGNGLLTMLTVAGSASAEAYATNKAADRLHMFRSQRESFADAIRPITQLRARAQALFTWAATVRSAGAHEAAAAMNTTLVVANPATYDPRTFGHLSPMPAESTRVELRQTLPEVVEPPALAPASVPTAVVTAEVIRDINKALAGSARPEVSAPGTGGEAAGRTPAPTPAEPSTSPLALSLSDPMQPSPNGARQ